MIPLVPVEPPPRYQSTAPRIPDESRTRYQVVAPWYMVRVKFQGEKVDTCTLDGIQILCPFKYYIKHRHRPGPCNGLLTSQVRRFTCGVRMLCQDVVSGCSVRMPDARIGTQDV